jgi:hypothetical protein
MNTIAKFLHLNVNEIRLNRKFPQYRVRTSSLHTNINIKNYLNSFPLVGTKYMDYLDWCRVLDYFEKGQEQENKTHIVEIKSQMNHRRTVYNWDHLQ